MGTADLPAIAAVRPANPGDRIFVGGVEVTPGARITLEAARRRQREVLMGPGKPVVWLQAIAPALADWMIQGAFMRSVRRRHT